MLLEKTMWGNLVSATNMNTWKEIRKPNKHTEKENRDGLAASSVLVGVASLDSLASPFVSFAGVASFAGVDSFWGVASLVGVEVAAGVVSLVGVASAAGVASFVGVWGAAGVASLGASLTGDTWAGVASFFSSCCTGVGVFVGAGAAVVASFRWALPPRTLKILKF